MNMSKIVFLQDVDFNGSPMVRHDIRRDAVSEYMESYKKDKTKMPNIVLFSDEKGRYLIADGMHRFLAMAQLKFKAFPAEVLSGNYESALSYALTANERHGLRRSQADRRRCIEAAIKQWPAKSNLAIAGACDVDNHTVKAVRDELEKRNQVKPEPIRESKSGKRVPASRPAKVVVGNSQVESKPKATEKLTEKDKTGYVLTAHALRFWNRTHEVSAVVSQLSELSDLMTCRQKEQDLMYSEVNFSAALSDLDKLITNIETAIPYAVCATCQGHPDTQKNGCRMCKGKGLVSKFMWDKVPQEIRKLRSK